MPGCERFWSLVHRPARFTTCVCHAVHVNPRTIEDHSSIMRACAVVMAVMTAQHVLQKAPAKQCAARGLCTI